MPYFQTCKRHPQAGRFLAECSGCKRELFDIAERNRAQAAARTALAGIGTLDARIIDAAWVRGALVVATHQPRAYLPYAVDSFRLPTAAETDPDQTDPRTPGEWMLVDQIGDHDETTVPRMLTQAADYLRQLIPLKALAS